MRLLVDGNGLACRLWWARPTDVEERFLNIVERAAPAKEAVVCWDYPGPTWRHELLPSYKGQRKGKPDLLVHVLKRCQKITELVHVMAKGYEADDLIATLAKAALEVGDTVLILSDDKDLCQLVSYRCSLLNAKGEITDIEAVKRKWGVPPERIRLLLSWMGDWADGLPGVRGIGKKRAVAKALDGTVGDLITYDLVELAMVPEKYMRWSNR